MIKLAPSILSADFASLGSQLKIIETSKVEMIHIDVMDGNFVPSISFGIPVISSIRKATNLFFDVHLMVNEPDRYISDFVKCGSDMITVHAEACTHLHRTIQNIKSSGIKAGVALNPATPIDAIKHIIEDLDAVLIMTVNPGFGGQNYIESMTSKIEQVKELCKFNQIKISVDGGIKKDNVDKVIKAGADIVVAGSAVFNGNLKDNIEGFYSLFSNI